MCLAFFQPFGFLPSISCSAVFVVDRSCGRVVPMLALTLALQKLPYFGTYDVQDAHARTVLGWSSQQLSFYRTAEGVTDFMQGALASFTVSTLGPLWGTATGCLASGVAFVLQALSHPGARWRRGLMYVGVGLLSFPPEAVPEALLVNAAAAAGVGKGRLMADASNVAALMKMCGPSFLGSFYFWGKNNNIPQAWGVAACGSYVGALLIFLLSGARSLRLVLN